MITPRDSVREFAGAAVRAELVRGGAPSEVAQHVVTRLRDELGKLIGPTGFEVLLVRALVLARRADPTLAGITIGAGGTFGGFEDRPDAEREKAATDIIAYFLELLVTLVGEDLAMRLVRHLWPGGDGENNRP
jgi:hypothetical protein